MSQSKKTLELLKARVDAYRKAPTVKYKPLFRSEAEMRLDLLKAQVNRYTRPSVASVKRATCHRLRHLRRILDECRGMASRGYL